MSGYFHIPLTHPWVKPPPRPETSCPKASAFPTHGGEDSNHPFYLCLPGYRFPPMNISPSHCFRMPVMSLASSQPIHLMDATLQSSVLPPSPPTPTPLHPPEESMMLKLIALQNADGSWGTDVGLEPLLGLKLEQAKQALPRQEIDLSIWLTILAVIWLHHFAADSKNEWEFLVDKAISWIKAKAGPDLAECVNAGNNLLKTTVGLETLGL
ncbi:von Willebrand factor A domain-containing protein 5A-like isoform X3 [Narcine bancroftii]|uniref:von Willebrand factor A domain-containing protein 5A-like isoform X3 n=1 Tax=Narcine bancroftii TaxID=1343680 RepID=UPI0038318CFC